MKIDHFDLDERIMIVAEIGNNHEGDFTLAQDLIGLAAEAGAHAVKFQTFRTEDYVSRHETDRFARLKSFELSGVQFERLREIATEVGVLFLSTPFDIASAQLLAPLVAAMKIASGDSTFFPLLEAVAQTAKPILLSTGMATLDEIRAAKNTIERVWKERSITQEMAILHCVSSYPVPPEQANLAAISNLGKEFGCTVGYSDHTMGNEAAAISVALGARIVEKHFTIDKHYSEFRDHQLSADPAELRELVDQIQRIVMLMGNGEKIPQPSEAAATKSLRRSIAARRDLAVGTIVVAEDLTWVRPASGLAPGNEHLVLGRRLLEPITAGDPILLQMLANEATG